MALAVGAPASAQWDPSSSSAFGGADEDVLRGARILDDARIVVAGSASVPADAELLAGATSGDRAVVARLSHDGRELLGASRLPGAVWDLDGYGADLVVAAGDGGLIVMDEAGTSVRWREEIGHVHRVAIGSDGTIAALVPSNVGDAETAGGSGRVHIFEADGTPIADFEGYRNTQDIAVDAASATVVLIGWRQANAFDGSTTNPVQIAYLRGVGYDGETRWTDYDWSTDRDSPDFLNGPTNNMADTRGYRVAVGRDGRLLAAFEVAGGNHIFRYSPSDIDTEAEIVGGDRYHEFFDTRSEHKTFFGIYEPADGAYVAGQQLVGRLSSGSGNTVRVRGGAITSDEEGRVYIAGTAAAGLPIDFLPDGTGDYTGGAFLIVMSADLSERLLVTRVDPGGGSHAVDARVFGGSPTTLFAGETSDDASELWSFEAHQEPGGGQDGFSAVIGAPTDAPEPVDGGPGTPRVDAGPGAADGGDPGGDDSAGGGDGCGCSTTTPAGGVAWLAVLGLLIGWRRRR